MELSLFICCRDGDVFQQKWELAFRLLPFFVFELVIPNRIPIFMIIQRLYCANVQAAEGQQLFIVGILSRPLYVILGYGKIIVGKIQKSGRDNSNGNAHEFGKGLDDENFA